MFKRLFRFVLGAAVIGVIAVTVVYVCRVPIGEYLASRTLNREVRIAEIEIAPGPVTRLHARAIEIANAPWAEPATPLAELGTLSLEVDVLRSLSSGRLHLPLIAVADGTLRVTFDPDKGANFAGMPGRHDTSSELQRRPAIGRLTIAGLGFSLTAPEAALDISGTIEARDGTAAGLALTARGDGVLRAREVTFDLSVGGLDAWQRRSEGYPLRAALKSADAVIDIDGLIADPLAFSGFRFDVRLAGSDTAAIGAFMSLPLPDLPPYDVRAQVYDDGQSITVIKRLSGRFGDSDLDGDGRYDPTGERPRFVADLHSGRLDLDDLAGIIGAPPDSGPGETSSAADVVADARRDARPTAIPRTPLKLDQLSRADLQVRYRADAIDTPHVPLANLDVTVRLEAGTLQLRPLRVALGGGEFSAEFSLEPSGEVTLSGELDRVSLKAILRDLNVTNEAAGKMSGWFDVASVGNNTGDWLGGLNGAINLLTEGGQFDSVLVELLGLDVGEALVAHLSDSERVQIRCGAITAVAEDGKLGFRKFVIDTSDSVVRGSGHIALGAERYALQLKAKAKDFSMLSGDAPIYLNGTFKQPDVALDIGETLLSLLTPIEFGDATNVDCSALVPQRPSP